MAAWQPLPRMVILNSLLEAKTGPLLSANSPAFMPGQLWMPKIASIGKRSNRPSLIISRAPPPPSSAGWKIRYTVPSKSRWRARCWAAASSMAVWPSCPQACILPAWRLAWAKVLNSCMGSASMSARRPMARPQAPPSRPCTMPTTPVVPMPRWMGIPHSVSLAATRSAVRCSSKHSSGWAWMSRRSAAMASACTAMVSMTFMAKSCVVFLGRHSLSPVQAARSLGLDYHHAMLHEDPSRTALRQVRGACPHDCPDTCALLTTVENGVATRVQGNPAHAQTGGVLCAKVSKYPERTYHAERILTPLKRSGPKGSGQFTPVTWDEALTDIAAHLGAIAARDPQAIQPYSYAGTMGLVQGESMDRRFFHRLGASLLHRSICATAGGEGLVHTLGGKVGMKVEFFAEAKLILIWGSNSIGSNLHFWRIAQQAKRGGAKLVCIDPRKSETAEKRHP